MANIQSYLDQIEGARYGKDVRSSIVKAIDAVNTESNNSVEKVNAAELRVNTAVTNANAATTSANTAATKANTAAFNANEAAQAVLDEKYILTATTEMVRSGTARPTAKGNALLEGLTGDSWQKQLSGKNKLNNILSETRNGITATLNADKSTKIVGTTTASGAYWFVRNLALPAGTYTYSVKSEGTNVNGTCIIETDSSPATEFGRFSVKTGNEVSFTLDSETNVRANVYFPSGTTVDATFYPMISVEGGDYEPYCGATPSPNPEFPQTIHSTGDNGWFDGEWVKGYLSNGEISNTTNAVVSKNKIPCKDGGIVKISYSGGNLSLKPANGTMRVAYYDVNGAYISSTINGVGEYVSEFTAPSGTASFMFDVRFDVESFEISDVGNVCVTINGKYAAILECKNKNAWTFGNLTATSASHVINYKALPLPKGTHAISFDASIGSAIACEFIFYSNHWENEVGRQVMSAQTTSGGRQKATVTLTDDATHVSVWINGVTSISNIQIEPSKATDYEVHTHKRTYIPLDEPLKAIGDVKDELVPVDGWYKVLRRVGYYVFDGSSDGWWSVDNQYGITFRHYLESLKIPSTDKTNYLCNYFTPVSYKADWSVESFVSNLTVEPSAVVFKHTSITTVDDFNVWLAEHNVIFEYELATPYYEELDQTPFYNIPSFDEVTHVSIAGLHEELQPTITMRFPRHEDGALVTTSYCNSKKAEIRMDELTAAMLALSQS